MFEDAAGFGELLWAMTLVPVAVLRETSILFAIAISGMVLKERISPARLAAAAIVATGAAVLRLV